MRAREPLEALAPSSSGRFPEKGSPSSRSKHHLPWNAIFSPTPCTQVVAIVAMVHKVLATVYRSLPEAPAMFGNLRDWWIGCLIVPYYRFWTTPWW